MIAGIKKAFMANLPHVTWMDEETKVKALNKVNSNYFCDDKQNARVAV